MPLFMQTKMARLPPTGWRGQHAAQDAALSHVCISVQLAASIHRRKLTQGLLMQGMSAYMYLDASSWTASSLGSHQTSQSYSRILAESCSSC